MLGVVGLFISCSCMHLSTLLLWFFLWVLILLLRPILVCLPFLYCVALLLFFFSSRRRHTRCLSDWSSDVCSSDLSQLGQCAGLGRLAAVADGLIDEAGVANRVDAYGRDQGGDHHHDQHGRAALGRSEERRVGKEGRSRL